MSFGFLGEWEREKKSGLLAHLSARHQHHLQTARDREISVDDDLTIEEPLIPCRFFAIELRLSLLLAILFPVFLFASQV
jgi:hypothetical protein